MSNYDFERKHALLDTNILSQMTRQSKKSESFRPVFEFLKENNCQMFVTDATRFEFAGFSTNNKDFCRVLEWIEQFPSLLITKEDIETATLLSAMYKCKNPNINPKQISFVDCLHASQLIKYKERAFIVTSDVNDYPSFLFDMPHHQPIEMDSGETSLVSFKTYNEEKYRILEEDFRNSGN